MNVRFLLRAENELDAAFRWYEDQLPGLGYDFLIETDVTLKRIVTFPDSCRIIEDNLRRCMIRRFPYAVIYGIDSNDIIVVAIAHLHRKPDCWKGSEGTGG